MSSSELDTLPVPPQNLTQTPYLLGVVSNPDHVDDQVGQRSSSEEIPISVIGTDPNNASVDELEALEKQTEEKLRGVQVFTKSASDLSLSRVRSVTDANADVLEEPSTSDIVSQLPTLAKLCGSAETLEQKDLSDSEPGSKRMEYIHPDGWIYYVYQDEQIVTADDLPLIVHGQVEGKTYYYFSTEQHSPGAQPPTKIQDTAKIQAIPASFPLRPEMEILVSNEHGQMTVTYINHILHYASDDICEVTKPDAVLNAAVYTLRSKYWEIVCQFPSHRPLLSNSEDIARKHLVWYLTEGVVRGNETNAPFMLEEVRSLLSCLDVHQKTDGSAPNPHHSMSSHPDLAAKTFLVAWIMFNVAEHKARNCFGLRNRTTQPAPTVTNIFFKFLSVICFGAPTTHWGHIVRSAKRAKLHGDTQIWPTYIQALVKDWNTFNIAATILLSASVGFLSVPETTASTQTTSLLSLVFTLGSVMIGVFLTWRHQVGKFKLEYNISDISESQQCTLAVILSLPFMLLMWGVISFLVTVIIFSFQSQKTGPNSVPLFRWVSAVVLTLSLSVAGTAAFGIFRVRMLRVPNPGHKAPLLPC